MNLVATKIFAEIRDRLTRRYQKLDLMYLWPALKEAAEQRGMGVESAERAFLTHVRMESCWASMSDEEVLQILHEYEKARQSGD
jgi:hypothetical protein